MALVLAFLRDPAKAVAEMARVVRSGGWVAELYVGYSERRSTDHADLHGDRVFGVNSSGPAQPGSVAVGSHARLLGNGRAGGYRDPRHSHSCEVFQFR